MLLNYFKWCFKIKKNWWKSWCYVINLNYIGYVLSGFLFFISSLDHHEVAFDQCLIFISVYGIGWIEIPNFMNEL